MNSRTYMWSLLIRMPTFIATEDLASFDVSQPPNTLVCWLYKPNSNAKIIKEAWSGTAKKI